MLRYDISVELKVLLYLVSMRIKAGWSGSVMSVYSVYKISAKTCQKLAQAKVIIPTRLRYTSIPQRY